MEQESIQEEQQSHKNIVSKLEAQLKMQDMKFEQSDQLVKKLNLELLKQTKEQGLKIRELKASLDIELK